MAHHNHHYPSRIRLHAAHSDLRANARLECAQLARSDYLKQLAPAIMDRRGNGLRARGHAIEALCMDKCGLYDCGGGLRGNKTKKAPPSPLFRLLCPWVFFFLIIRLERVF